MTLDTRLKFEKDPPIRLKLDEEITLREYELADAEAIFALIDRNRPHLSQYDEETSKKYPDLKSVENSIGQNPLKLRFGIWTPQNLVGTVNLTLDMSSHAMSNSAMIGYYLGEEFGGRGYMVRSVDGILNFAEKRLKLPKVSAIVHRGNKRSLKVLERTGFELEKEYRNSSSLFSKQLPYGFE